MEKFAALKWHVFLGTTGLHNSFLPLRDELILAARSSPPRKKKLPIIFCTVLLCTLRRVGKLSETKGFSFFYNEVEEINPAFSLIAHWELVLYRKKLTKIIYTVYQGSVQKIYGREHFYPSQLYVPASNSPFVLRGGGVNARNKNSTKHVIS